MTDNLQQALATVARLASEMEDADRRNDTKAAERIRVELEAASWRLHRLSQRATQRPSLSRAPSARERAVAALTELGVPSAPKAIATYAEAKTGEPFDVRWLASVRRDEFRSWTSGSRRETYVVPALEEPWFVAGRGRFALSHWPLWQRIVGPLSPRADHLRACLQIVRQMEAVGAQSEKAARLRDLLVRYVRTVPGALDDAWNPAQAVNVDLARVREAVVGELNVIQNEDEVSRQHEAERAMRKLDDQQLIWGGTMPQVVTRTIA